MPNLPTACFGPLICANYLYILHGLLRIITNKHLNDQYIWKLDVLTAPFVHGFSIFDGGSARFLVENALKLPKSGQYSSKSG